MKRIFDIKRTRMVDEATLGHTPTPLGRVFLAFFLVYIISTTASNLIGTFPIAIYNFIVALKNGAYAVFEEAIYKGDMDTAYEFMLDITSNMPWWAFVLQLLASAFMIVATIFYCKKFEKRSVSSLGLRKKGIAIEILLGLLIGGALIGLCFILTSGIGSVGYEFKGFSPTILFFIPAFLVFSFAEEILVRGFYMTSLARDYNPWVCIIVSSLIFSLFNLSYLSVIVFINTFLFNVMLSILVFKRGSIYSSSIVKFVWGFVGANVLGRSVFGFIPMPSMFTPIFASNKTLISGGEIGFIGGIITSILLVCLIFILLLLKTKKSEESEVKIEYFN